MAVIYEKGLIHQMGEIKQGVSKAGRPWANMTLVVAISTTANTFKYLALKVETDRIDDVKQFKVGDHVEVGYVTSSREYNGNWYSDIKLAVIRPEAAPVTREYAEVRIQQAQAQTSESLDPSMNTDDLPF